MRVLASDQEDVEVATLRNPSVEHVRCIYVRVCVRACVCACVYARVCTCTCTCVWRRRGHEAKRGDMHQKGVRRHDRGRQPNKYKPYHFAT